MAALFQQRHYVAIAEALREARRVAEAAGDVAYVEGVEMVESELVRLFNARAEFRTETFKRAARGLK